MTVSETLLIDFDSEIESTRRLLERIPEKDPQWGKQNLIAVKDGKEVKITPRPLPEMTPELAALFEEK